MKKETIDMKKFIIFVCIVALMMSFATVAYAETDTSTSETETVQNVETTAEGSQINGEKPKMIDFDALASKGVISQETCEKIKAYMKENTPADIPGKDGQPTDLKEQSSQADSQPPQMNGEAPQMNGQAPQMNGKAPQMNGEAPQMNGQAPQMNGEAPKSDGQDMNGEAPADLPSMPEMNGGSPANGLLNDLLSNGVITQAEYDALSEAIAG